MNSGSEKIYQEAASREANFFNGGTNDDAQFYDPLVTGYALIIFTRFPVWVEKEYPNCKTLLQKNFRGFDGLQDIDLNTNGSQEGYSQNEYHVALNMSAKPNTFNLKHLEYSGSPIANLYTHWVTGIRDPRTGIATYPKKYDLEYAAKNHTCELMYIVLRPDADNKDKDIIEFACYWTNAMPKRIPMGHWNYAKGQQTSDIEIDMPFSGVFHRSPKVDEAAVALFRQGAHGYDFLEENNYDPANWQASNVAA
jgi:hypothetical protein